MLTGVSLAKFRVCLGSAVSVFSKFTKETFEIAAEAVFTDQVFSLMIS